MSVGRGPLHSGGPPQPAVRAARRLPRLALVVGVLGLAVWFGNDLARAAESDAPSESIGATNGGRLVYGKRMPTQGPGFVSYSRLGAALGRTAVHSQVRDALLASYAAAHAERGVVYVLGETGWPSGGRFRPHRTHQNGLSVDFMVPVLRDGAPAPIPTGPLQRFGYAVAFGADGRSAEGLEIDAAALADHLWHLDRAATAHGLAIDVVIYAPDLQAALAETARGADVLRRLRFSRNPSWVRHDDHDHVDFRLTSAEA